MAEYIDKTEIIKAIVAEASHCLVLDKPAEARGYIGAKELIERRKAADVAEVRHGRWFFKYPNGWACSRCGEWGLMIDNRGICKSSYCPNCGARMDKEDEHGSEFD